MLPTNLDCWLPLRHLLRISDWVICDFRVYGNDLAVVDIDDLLYGFWYDGKCG